MRDRSHFKIIPESLHSTRREDPDVRTKSTQDKLNTRRDHERMQHARLDQIDHGDAKDKLIDTDIAHTSCPKTSYLRDAEWRRSS